MSDDEVERDDTEREELELDELTARAQSHPGALRLPDELLDGRPLSLAGYPGSAAIPATGDRRPRPATTTSAVPAGLRHNWVPIGPADVAGRIRSLACADPGAADPQTWYAASAGGGVWKTVNGGRRWEPLWHAQPSLSVGAIAVAPSNPSRIYAATGEAVPASHLGVRGFGVLVSTDAGATWTGHPPTAASAADPPNPAHRGGFEAVAVHPTDERHCWAVGVDGAFRTLDGGTTWEQFGAGTHFTDVAFAPGGSARVYLVRGTSTAGEGAVIRLDAPGTAAAAVTAELGSVNAASIVIAPRGAHRTWPAAGKIAISPSTPATAYIRWVGDDDRHLGIFRTANAAAAQGRAVTWTRLRDHSQFGDERQGGYALCIAVHPTRPEVVATGMLYVHVSVNATAAAGSVAWRRVMAWQLHARGLRGHHADQHDIVIAGNPAQLWVADDGGIARSTDWLTAGSLETPNRLLPSPQRPLPPGSPTWRRRDAGISGAQMYDLAQSPHSPAVLAGGLQDNGTYLRTGGRSWRMVFGADGGYAAFDPDDPFQLYIAYYAGLAVLGYPALRDAAFPDDASDLTDATFRLVRGQPAFDFRSMHPFVPVLARHPRRTGRALQARDGRLYGFTPSSGERFVREPLGTSFQLVMFAAAPPPPPAVPPPTDVVIADTAGARGLGLIPGHYIRRDRTGVLLPSRLPAPYILAEGDQLQVTLNGTPYTTTFNAAAGVTPGAVTVADVDRLVLAAMAGAGDTVEVRPSIWDTPSEVELVTGATGAAAQIVLAGDALDPLADGLSRLGVNAGTYRGAPGRPASVRIGFIGVSVADAAVNRDFGGAVRTLQVSVGAGPARSVRIEPPAFGTPARITAGQLAAALRTALAAEIASGAITVTATHHFVTTVLRASPGLRVVLSGTAAARLGAPARGEPVTFLDPQSRTAQRQHLHLRNWCSLDLRPDPPAAPALELVISDGTHATPPLRFTAADVADLRAVTPEEVQRLVAAHLAASPAVAVTAELFGLPIEAAATELVFSPAGDDHIWAGTADGRVFRTVDDGGTWTEVGDAAMRLSDRPVTAIAFSPDGHTAYVGLAGDPGPDPVVFRSDNADAAPPAAPAWAPLAGVGAGVSAIELDPADPAAVIVATDGGVVRSPDRGATWAPFSDGLPNAPVADLAVEPITRVVRAAVWTRGVYERRLDARPPADAVLLIRATELDDGTRPARAAPALGSPAPGPVPLGSPDIRVVRRRPDIGPDADVEGVTFDLEVLHDDVLPGATAEVFVQVANLSGLSVPAPRLVVLFAPVDSGVPGLPAELWMRLAAGPLAGGFGAWTVLGDGALAGPIAAGGAGVRSFGVTWPALDGVRTLGLLALVTSPADPLPAGPLDVGALLASQPKAAYRGVPVVAPDDDRTLVLASVDGRDFVLEQPAPPQATGVADRLGFAPADIGAAGRRRVSATAAGATLDLSVAAGAAGPGILLRTAAPVTADLALLPAADEADDPARVWQSEVAAMINRRAGAIGLPVTASAPQTGLSLLCSADARIRVTGGDAAPRLGLPVGGAGVTGLATPRSVAWFNLAGVSRCDLEVVLPGGNVAVRVDLPADLFEDPGHADPADVVAAIADALADAEMSSVVQVFSTSGLAVAGVGEATLTAAGAAAPLLGLPAGPDRVLAGVPPRVDLTAGPVLHLEVTPRVLVRFDGDPADIADLTQAGFPDIRRAIKGAAALAGVGVRALAAGVDLRVAASPEDGGPARPVLGGAHLAELAASAAAVAPADRPGLFAVRPALGTDRLTIGTANHLYLRVRNLGSADAAAARLRLLALDVSTSPVTHADIASATPAVPAGAVHIEELAWDPGGAARTQLVLTVADQDIAGRRVDVPASFASVEAVRAFAARAGVALRLFDVVAPAP